MGFLEMATQPCSATPNVTPMAIVPLPHLLDSLPHIVDVAVCACHQVDHPARYACIFSLDFVFSVCFCADEFFCPFFHFTTADTPLRQVLPTATTWLVVGVTLTFPVLSFDCYSSHTWGLFENHWNFWDQLPQGWIFVAYLI